MMETFGDPECEYLEAVRDEPEQLHAPGDPSEGEGPGDGCLAQERDNPGCGANPPEFARQAERPTPRTDAKAVYFNESTQVVNASFARDLERQLAEAREQRDRLADACKAAKLHFAGEALPTKQQAIIAIDEALASVKTPE